MTFTEAALEVLRLAGRPLHYKKITEIAIEKNLLSHVGKTPDVTMSSRLATLVKKDRGDAAIIRVKSGYFGLREWDEAALEVPAGEAAEPEDAAVAPVVPTPAAKVEPAAEDTRPGSEPAAAREAPAEGERAGRERRGRRRRGRDRREDAPTPAVAEVAAAPDTEPPPPPEAAPEVEAAPPAPEPTEDASDTVEVPVVVRERRDTEHAPAPEDEGAGAGAAEPSAAEAAEERGDDDELDDDDEPILGPAGAEQGKRRRRRRRGRDEGDRGEPDRAPAARGAERAERPERAERVERVERVEREAATPRRDDGTEPTGKDLGDAIAAILAGGDRSPLGVGRIAELLVRKGRLTGEAGQHHQAVAAAVRADIAAHAARARRHRFRVLGGGRFALTEWAYPAEALRHEAEATAVADRQRDAVYRAFFKRLAELPGPAAAELVASWLGSLGAQNLRVVRRPGASGAELHLACTLKRGVEETRIAVVVRRDMREVGRERVIEMRGALQHYGPASAAWIVTTGAVLSGAREEAATPAAAPVALFDGTAFGRALEEAGIGIRRASLPLAVLDLDLLDTLRGPTDRPS